jgi:hypothetical protein
MAMKPATMVEGELSLRGRKAVRLISVILLSTYKDAAVRNGEPIVQAYLPLLGCVAVQPRVHRT